MAIETLFFPPKVPPTAAPTRRKRLPPKTTGVLKQAVANFSSKAIETYWETTLYMLKLTTCSKAAMCSNANQTSMTFPSRTHTYYSRCHHPPPARQARRLPPAIGGSPWRVTPAEWGPPTVADVVTVVGDSLEVLSTVRLYIGGDVTKSRHLFDSMCLRTYTSIHVYAHSSWKHLLCVSLSGSYSILLSMFVAHSFPPPLLLFTRYVSTVMSIVSIHRKRIDISKPMFKTIRRLNIERNVRKL